MGKQCPLQAQHVPSQDLITAAHGSQSFTMLDTVPGGHNGTGLHWDGPLAWENQQHLAHTAHNSCLIIRMVNHLLLAIYNIHPPFSTLVRSFPCLAFSNRGWWPATSSPASLQDLSNRAPSPQGAVLWVEKKQPHKVDGYSTNQNGMEFKTRRTSLIQA